jgi:hypothetical protein
MQKINSHKELIYNLAQKGDPSAFYTLVLANIKSVYTIIRTSGKDHNETMQILVPFLRKLYNKFLTKPPKNSFNEWFDKNVNKNLKKNINYNELKKTESDNIPHEDILHLENQTRLIFERYRKKILINKKASSSIVRYFIITATVLILFIVFVIISQICLIYLNTKISISISSPKYNKSLSMPSAKMAGIILKENKTISHGSLYYQQKSNDKTYTSLETSIKNKDSLSTIKTQTISANNAKLNIKKDSVYSPPKPVSLKKDSTITPKNNNANYSSLLKQDSIVKKELNDSLVY